MSKTAYKLLLTLGGYYNHPNIAGFRKARTYSFLTAYSGCLGLGLTLRRGSQFFKWFAYASAPLNAFVSYLALSSGGWYDTLLDSTDPAADTIDEYDPYYAKAKNILLFGSLTTLLVDAYAIAMPLLAGPPPTPTQDELTPAEEQPAPTELEIW